MLEDMARSDFERASRKAVWNKVWSLLFGKTNELLPFEEVQARLPVAGQYYRGLQVVPLRAIAGSVGRYRDFDRAFLPRQRQTRDRWISVDLAHHKDIRLPPIELYKVGEVYFVKDGNHRVSVARERDQEFIDAVVTEIDTPVEIAPDTDMDELIRRVEKADFFLRTNLNRLRPDNAIRLTLPGGYEKLLEHIQVHRWYLGVENDREMGWEEAVQSWYDRVYLPVVEVIRAQHILDDFPTRTETDLYLWIIEHRATLRDDPEEIPVEAAATDFVEKKSKRPARRAARVVQAVRNTLVSIGTQAEELVDPEITRPDEGWVREPGSM